MVISFGCGVAGYHFNFIGYYQMTSYTKNINMELYNVAKVGLTTMSL